MGILDDAIRQHLDLKRQTGADESEVKQLEDEAFGPPARPGDKNFPASGDEATEASATSSATEAPSEEQPVAEAPSEEQPLAEAPSQEQPLAEEPSEELPLADEQAAPLGEEASAGIAEPQEAASSFTTAEREAIADQPTSFFDQAEGSALDMGELDLDLDEELEEVGGSVDQPLTEEQPFAGADPPPVQEPLAQPEVPAAEQLEPPHATEPEPAAVPDSEPSPTPAPIPEPAPAPETAPAAPTPDPGAEPQDLAQPPAPPDDAAGGEEDVLEETPEFLRENPDDDELWFEQGEPKDFDF